MAQKEITVKENQKRMLDEAGQKINQLTMQRDTAQHLLNEAANNANNLISIICDAEGIEATEGTRYHNGKIIVPQPNRAVRRKAAKQEKEVKAVTKK